MKLRLLLLVVICIILNNSCFLVDFSSSSGDTNINVSDYSSGVAPLAVFFDGEDYGAAYADEPFHDLEYRWNFGDTANENETWDYGARPGEILKNETTGPVSAHVYEVPGDYRATLTIWDGSDEAVKTVTYSITVTDPETVFAESTYAVSFDGDFSDAPSGATELTSSDFDSAMATALAAGAKRILFKAGQSFDFDSTTTISGDGPYLVGSFGSGDSPVITATDGSVYGIYYQADDIRVMDLEFDGASFTDSTVRAASIYADNALLLRVYAHDLGCLAACGGSNIAIVECEEYNIVGGSGNMGIWAADVFGFFVAGNKFDNNSGGEHCLRYQGGTEGVFCSNYFTKAASMKHLLTIRGDGDEEYVSGRHVVNDNYFDGTDSPGTFLNTIAPQNSVQYEPIEDVIWERNYHRSGSSTTRHLVVTAYKVTVRNNLCDTSDASSSVCFSLSGPTGDVGLPDPYDHKLYNNTIYSNGTGGLTGIQIYSEEGVIYNTVIKNNFLYAPNTTLSGENNGGPNMYTDYESDGDAIISSNTLNADISSESTDVFLHLAVQPPSDDPNDWILQSNSYGASRGEDVPVWSDYFGESLYDSSSRNLGAILAQ
ncbi:MAG: hypothetical protein PQJ59_02030 [Spirochaetales bacterium]|nr:hypothetical protein [Spirochaetales bacterium]